jgi:hypothetical protein
MAPDRRGTTITLPGCQRPLLCSKQGNCWRVERADRLALIIDAEAYFKAVKEAILSARHSVYLIGWDFDTRIKFEPDGKSLDHPNKLGPFAADETLLPRRALRGQAPRTGRQTGARRASSWQLRHPTSTSAAHSRARAVFLCRTQARATWIQPLFHAGRKAPRYGIVLTAAGETRDSRARRSVTSIRAFPLQRYSLETRNP